MPASIFIHAMHPKTEIRPTEAAIAKVLQSGWVGQIKIHGHRAQIHISADAGQPVLAYNRQGRLHKLAVAPKIVAELRRLFAPASGWTVIDAEWLKPEGKIFVFDVLKEAGKSLIGLSYIERWQRLPRAFISPSVSVLGLIDSVEKCLEILASDDPHIEGLVFKARATAGFRDSSIIRCRRPKSRAGALS